MSVSKTVVALLGALVLASPAGAADLPAPLAQPAAPTFVPGWTFRMTSYGWFTALNGSQTVRGRSVDVNASFIDIVENTIGDGGSLLAVMLDAEARNGPVALFADVIGEKITIEKSGLKTKSVAPGITGTVGAAVDMQFQMAIVEAGAAYEVGTIGAASFDVLAGARYWRQKLDVGFDIAGTVDLGGLSIKRGAAIARSGSVDWLDAFAGVRARVELAPNHHLELRGDIGAGGSKLTWQALAAYAYDFKTANGVTYSAVLGYKALYVDYSQGIGPSRYAFDMLQHGPVLGLSVRF